MQWELGSNVCFNANCYVLHMIITRLEVGAEEILNCHVSFMPYIDVNPAEFWGRFATKGGGWFPPLGGVYLSPESHHTVLQH